MRYLLIFLFYFIVLSVKGQVVETINTPSLLKTKLLTKSLAWCGEILQKTAVIGSIQYEGGETIQIKAYVPYDIRPPGSTLAAKTNINVLIEIKDGSARIDFADETLTVDGDIVGRMNMTTKSYKVGDAANLIDIWQKTTVVQESGMASSYKSFLNK